jgi:hypothetical protein
MTVFLFCVCVVMGPRCESRAHSIKNEEDE